MREECLSCVGITKITSSSQFYLQKNVKTTSINKKGVISTFFFLFTFSIGNSINVRCFTASTLLSFVANLFYTLLYEFIHVLFLMLHLSLLGKSSRGTSLWLHCVCWRPCYWRLRISGLSIRTTLHQNLRLYWESVLMCFIWYSMQALMFSFCHCTFQSVLCIFSISTGF